MKNFKVVKRGVAHIIEDVQSMVDWLSDLVEASVPRNGIEWWGEHKVVIPRPHQVHSPVVYARNGNEGMTISVGLCLNRLRRESEPMQVLLVATIKTFGDEDETRRIVSVINEALELVFSYEERPFIGEMYRKVWKDRSDEQQREIRQGVILALENDALVVQAKSTDEVLYRHDLSWVHALETLEIIASQIRVELTDMMVSLGVNSVVFENRGREASFVTHS